MCARFPGLQDYTEKELSFSAVTHYPMIGLHTGRKILRSTCDNDTIHRFRLDAIINK
jgi:hypothetical protein